MFEFGMVSFDIRFQLVHSCWSAVPVTQIGWSIKQGAGNNAQNLFYAS